MSLSFPFQINTLIPRVLLFLLHPQRPATTSATGFTTRASNCGAQGTCTASPTTICSVKPCDSTMSTKRTSPQPLPPLLPLLHQLPSPPRPRAPSARPAITNTQPNQRVPRVRLYWGVPLRRIQWWFIQNQEVEIQTQMPHRRHIPGFISQTPCPDQGRIHRCRLGHDLRRL